MLCFLCGYILNVLPRIMKINTHRISFLFAELISMCYVLKNVCIFCLHFKISKYHLNHEKNHSFNDSRWRIMTLSCSKKYMHYEKEKLENMLVIFAVWIFFMLLQQKYKLESRKKVYVNKDLCGVVMPSKDIKILLFNQYQHSDKTSSIV